MSLLQSCLDLVFPPARLEALQAGLKTGLDTAVILQPVAELLPAPALASSPAPGPPPAPQLVRERMAEISAALDTPNLEQVEVEEIMPKQAVEVQHSHSVEMEMQTEKKLIEANGSGSLSAENEDVAAIAKAVEECQVAENVKKTYAEDEREEEESKCVEEQNEKNSNVVAED